MRPYAQKTTDYQEPPELEQSQATAAPRKNLDDDAMSSALLRHPQVGAAQKTESSPEGRTPEPIQLRRQRAFCSNCGARIYDWCSHCRRGLCCQPGCARCAAANNPTTSLAQHPTDSSERTPDAAMPPAAAVTTPDDGYTTAGTNPIDYPSTSSQRSFSIRGRVRKDCDTPQRSICFDATGQPRSPAPRTDLCNVAVVGTKTRWGPS